MNLNNLFFLIIDYIADLFFLIEFVIFERGGMVKEIKVKRGDSIDLSLYNDILTGLLCQYCCMEIDGEEVGKRRACLICATMTIAPKQ